MLPLPILALLDQNVARLHVTVSHSRLMNAVKASMQGNHEVEQKFGTKTDCIVFHELIQGANNKTVLPSPSAGRASPSNQS